MGYGNCPSLPLSNATPERLRERDEVTIHSYGSASKKIGSQPETQTPSHKQTTLARLPEYSKRTASAFHFPIQQPLHCPSLKLDRLHGGVAKSTRLDPHPHIPRERYRLPFSETGKMERFFIIEERLSTTRTSHTSTKRLSISRSVAAQQDGGRYILTVGAMAQVGSPLLLFSSFSVVPRERLFV